MASMIADRPDHSEELHRDIPRSSRGFKDLGISSAAFPSTLTGRWIGNGVRRRLTGTHIGC